MQNISGKQVDEEMTTICDCVTHMHISPRLLFLCGLLLPHKGVRTLPNLGRVPLGTLSRCAVLVARDYINVLAACSSLCSNFGEPHPSHACMTLNWRYRTI